MPAETMTMGRHRSPGMPPPVTPSSRLLQLAERSNPRNSSPSGNSNLLSFRNKKVAENKAMGPPVSSGFDGRRVPQSSPQYQYQGPTQTQTPVRQTPKMYTSFSKSSSKFTKAFIRSDPLKTDIQHLVATNGNISNKSQPEPENPNPPTRNSFISTPLKALHASFHDKGKLTRSRLFSQRVAKSSPPEKVPPPDILNCLESNYIIMSHRRPINPLEIGNNIVPATPTREMTPEKVMPMSTATPMKISSSAQRAQIVTLTRDRRPLRPEIANGFPFHPEKMEHNEKLKQLFGVEHSQPHPHTEPSDERLQESYNYKPLMDEGAKMSRKSRSKSLPKSFLSGRRPRSVLPSLLTRDDLTFSRLEERRPSLDLLELGPEGSSGGDSPGNSCSISPSGESTSSSVSSSDLVKMRWQRSANNNANSANSNSSSSPSGEGSSSARGTSGSRPKSFDYSQRKAWMKYYRDMEVSSTRPSKGSISSHIHLLEDVQDHPDPNTKAPPHRQQGPPSTSLFQRFSKTFSLRFGSNSNVHKSSGSDRDLPPIDKLRKGKSSKTRGEKCQSGDSGIGIDDSGHGHNPRIRRIRSEYIDTSSSGGRSSSTVSKMSLVEIPNHVWDEKKEGDDGFSSGEGEDCSEKNPDLNTSSSSNSSNARDNSRFHSLPHKNRNRGLPPTNSRSLEEEPSSISSSDSGIRSKVLREILTTEGNYVKTLNDIVQGFLVPCRKRRDLFAPEVVRNIFSNLEDILKIHARFLEDLKSNDVGTTFCTWADHFCLVYTEYCLNNPISSATLRRLLLVPEYSEFFEACRRLQLMDKLPLHGFLLRPIQRICQYHLQLAELLKHTQEDCHQDRKKVEEAVEKMKGVAMKINDTQRQFDALLDIIKVQKEVEAWEGPDLVKRNCSILMRGELVKTVVGKRNKEVHCILLNKNLVFCRKDYIKKGGLYFDGRIDLEVGVWLNIDSNEEDEYFGMVHNSFRVFSHDLSTWILFTAPTPAEKRKWIGALEKTMRSLPPEPRMVEMAKLTTFLFAQVDGQGPASNTPSGGSSSSYNTLPKSKKKLPQKKIDADAMLIEVSKLKRPAYNYQQERDVSRSSRFYV